MLKYINLDELASIKDYTMLSELFSYEELPNTNPLVITDAQGSITFANKKFWTSFNLQYGNNLSQLSFEPDLGSSLTIFSASNLSNLKYDHLFSNQSGFKYYSVEIQRIFINELQYFIFILKKGDPDRSLESKVASFSRALEFSKVALIIGDSTGKINYVTQSFETLLNRDIESIFNNTIPSVFYSHLPDKEFGKLLSAVSNKNEWIYQATFLLDSDEIKEVVLHLHVVKNGIEDSFSYILTCEDVILNNKHDIESNTSFTNSKENVPAENNQEQIKLLLEKERYLNQLRNSLLNNLSHEIRTPYTGIAGYSEIVDEFLKEGNYEAVKEIVFSVKEVLSRVLNVFSNVVELSQIESGEFTIEIQRLNCNQVLRSVFKKMKNNLSDKDIEMVLDEQSVDLIIDTDWIKLEKILTAVIENSIKFTKRGNITIASYREKNMVNISVIDTGIGIDKFKLGALIEPFLQEEDGYTRNQQGAGLGLTVAYRLTRLMNGSFKILSEKNEGTEIIISFPAAN